MCATSRVHRSAVSRLLLMSRLCGFGWCCTTQADAKKLESLKSAQLDSLKNIAGILDLEVSGTRVRAMRCERWNERLRERSID